MNQLPFWLVTHYHLQQATEKSLSEYSVGEYDKVSKKGRVEAPVEGRDGQARKGFPVGEHA